MGGITNIIGVNDMNEIQPYAELAQVGMTLRERVRRAVRRYGLGGCIRRATMWACRAAGRALYLRERHVWYRLDLASARPRFGFHRKFELVRASRNELPLLEQLETVGLPEAERRFASGAELWIVKDGAHAAFSCWIFRSRVPVLAASGGWLTLPVGTVCLEDSVTAPRYRGLGIAPAAWSGVADSLAQEGIEAIVTKVEEQNKPCRRSIERVGFRLVASMNLARVCMRSHVDVILQEIESTSAFLAERLARV